MHEAIGSSYLRVRRSRPDAARRGEQVVTLFRDHYNIPLVHVQAEAVPRRAPRRQRSEVKRKTIGRLFIEVFSGRKKIGGADFLAQGTLYPDVIESVSFTGGPR